MSYHKARPDETRDPRQPYSTIMQNGRVATRHAEYDGKPLLGGLQNAIVEGENRTPEEEKQAVKDYHEVREQMKKVQAQTFDPKTGKPKEKGIDFKPTPGADADAGPSAEPKERQANTEEVKKVVEQEKKPVAEPVVHKTEEKK